MTGDYRTYPGSKMKAKTFDGNTRPPKPQPVEVLDDFSLSGGRTFLVGGKEQDLYPVGALAAALNRRSVTIRKWESDGTIPNAVFMAMSGDKRGRRRLYTGEQIEGLRNIAREEGLLEPSGNGKWKAIEKTAFRKKAVDLFKNLEVS